jgi:hypothetical protein
MVDEQELETAIEAIQFSESKPYLTHRYLPYTRFCEDQAAKWRVGYHWMRIPAIVLAALVPALVAANLGTIGRVIATALGVVVAALSGVEHFLNVGGRSRHYRAAVELLKSEGWAYLTLATRYTTFGGHKAAFRPFVDHIEQMIKTDVSGYVALVATDTPTTAKPDAPAPAAKP